MKKYISKIYNAYPVLIGGWAWNRLIDLKLKNEKENDLREDEDEVHPIEDPNY